MHAELHEELRAAGFHVSPGAMGENITTSGVDLLALPTGARLHLGDSAVVEITGLRNPCVQIDRFQSGLMDAVLGRDAEGNLIRKAGVMSIVIASGEVCPAMRSAWSFQRGRCGRWYRSKAQGGRANAQGAQTIEKTWSERRCLSSGHQRFASSNLPNMPHHGS